MTFKEARAFARKSGSSAFMSIHKQKEIGWYVTQRPDQRAIFFVTKDGRIQLVNSDFARNYNKKYRERK